MDLHASDSRIQLAGRIATRAFVDNPLDGFSPSSFAAAGLMFASHINGLPIETSEVAEGSGHPAVVVKAVYDHLYKSRHNLLEGDEVNELAWLPAL